MGDIIRLQKYIAMCGAASRRGAEEQILAGRVKVNDQVVREMGVKVEIGADKVYRSDPAVPAAHHPGYAAGTPAPAADGTDPQWKGISLPPAPPRSEAGGS